jgi:protocatechuate 4,5-dioxygenase, beta chain
MEAAVADILAGLACSHAPSIAHAYDSERTQEPEWKPLFDAMSHARDWLLSLELDALVCIYNDHVDHFSLDTWPQFAIGTGDSFEIADEGWSPRPFPPVPGHPALATHLAQQLVDSGVDVAVCYHQAVDHGILSPLPLIDRDWAIPVVPLAVNVVFDPRPSPQRCWQMGEALGAAIRSFEPGARIGVVGTGGLSHQLTGPNFGRICPEWDREFMEKIEHSPDSLTEYTLEDFAKRGGEHSVEVVQWMAMRAAIDRDSAVRFAYYYPFQVMGYAVMGFEPVTR